MADINFTSLCTHDMPFFGTGSDIPFLKRVNVYLESVEKAKMDHDISDESVNHIAFDRKERLRKSLRRSRPKNNKQQKCSNTKDVSQTATLDLDQPLFFYPGNIEMKTCRENGRTDEKKHVNDNLCTIDHKNKSDDDVEDILIQVYNLLGLMDSVIVKLESGWAPCKKNLRIGRTKTR